MLVHSYSGNAWQFDSRGNTLKPFGGNGPSRDDLKVDGGFSAARLPYSVETLKELTSGHVRSITLNLTENCNLRCRYCTFCADFPGERKLSAKRMSFRTGKAAVDWLAEHSENEEKLSIAFFGGEPLLEFQLIIKLYEYAKGRLESKHVDFQVSTNATLIDDQFLKWVSGDANISVAVTVNGPASIHDRDRVYDGGRDSHAKVLERLETLLSTIESSRVTIQCNYRRFGELLKQQRWFVTHPALRDVAVIYSKVSEPPTSDARELNKRAVLREFDSVLEDKFRKQMIALADKLTMVPPALLVESTLLPAFHAQMNIAPSAAVVGHQGVCVPFVSRASIDVDGNFYFCEKSFNTPSCGNVNESGIDWGTVEKHIADCNNLLERLDCKNCPAVLYCRKCAVDFYREGSLKSVDEIKSSCVRHVEIFKKELAWYVSVLETNPKMIKNVRLSKDSCMFVEMLHRSAQSVVGEARVGS